MQIYLPFQLIFPNHPTNWDLGWNKSLGHFTVVDSEVIGVEAVRDRGGDFLPLLRINLHGLNPLIPHFRRGLDRSSALKKNNLVKE